VNTPDRDKTAPPAAGPEPGQNPGYAENEPRDKDDARHSPAPPAEEPEEGGLEREPGDDADPGG
jgi:hypothetical protein